MLEFQELELTNFKSYVDQKIPFDKVYNVQNGRNCSGKSSLL